MIDVLCELKVLRRRGDNGEEVGVHARGLRQYSQADPEGSARGHVGPVLLQS